MPPSALAMDWQQAVVAPYMDIPIVSLQVDGGDEDNGVSYEPNVDPEVGLALGYGDYSLNVGMPINQPDEKKGRTRHFDYGAGLDRDHWSIDGGFQRYAGFYINDDEAEYDEDHVYDQDPSLTKDARFVNLFVFPFQNHVNFKKTKLTTDVEDRAWSPVAHIGYELTELTSSQPLFASRADRIKAVDRDVERAQFESYIASAGLAGSIMLKRIRMVGLFLFGTGQQRRYLENDSDADTGWTHTERFALRGRMEMQHGDWLYALKMNLDQTNLRLRKTKIASDTGIIGLSVATQVDRFMNW